MVAYMIALCGGHPVFPVTEEEGKKESEAQKRPWQLTSSASAFPW